MLIIFTSVVGLLATVAAIRVHRLKKRYRVALIGIQKLDSLQPKETKNWSQYERPTWMRKTGKSRYFPVGT